MTRLLDSLVDRYGERVVYRALHQCACARLRELHLAYSNEERLAEAAAPWEQLRAETQAYL
jgi:hypothetical protein